MVFGQPVYNSEQRRAILQQYKNYIDDLREKKALSSWDDVEEGKLKKATKTKRRIKRDKTLSKNNKKRRKKRRRRRSKKSKITLAKLRNLLCNDRYIK